MLMDPSLLKMLVCASTHLADFLDRTCKFYIIMTGFSKDFLEKIGREGLYKMVQPFDDHSAYAQCIFAFCEGPGKEP